MDKFKKITLITNSDSPQVTDTLHSLISFLQSKDIIISLDKCSAAISSDNSLQIADENILANECDLAIAIGGDGTMLKAAHMVCDHNVPLLGINRGRLGFLADIPADAIDENLSEILAGHYSEDVRFLLYCQVLRNGTSIHESYAFNDIIIQKWNIARLVEFETYVDDTFVHKQRSDGMIVATPTGSTAYALAGGGPILYPSLDALVLVPICPHTLTNRPIVIHGNSHIEIVVGTREIDHARLTCDGEITGELAPGDRVSITKKDKKIRLLHPANHDHFSILRAKLQWG